ncbi:MAG: hypothetical protein HND50_15965 [Calditrichaeota bacterium]|nr:hypothetical protein [Calditrichota bacterium]
MGELRNKTSFVFAQSEATKCSKTENYLLHGERSRTIRLSLVGFWMEESNG